MRRRPSSAATSGGSSDWTADAGGPDGIRTTETYSVPEQTWLACNGNGGNESVPPMREQGHDALVLLGNTNVVYATGAVWPLADSGRANFEQPVAVVLVDDEWPHLFLPHVGRRLGGEPGSRPSMSTAPSTSTSTRACRPLPPSSRASCRPEPSSVRRMDQCPPPGAVDPVRARFRGRPDGGRVISKAKVTKTPDELSACARACKSPKAPSPRCRRSSPRESARRDLTATLPPRHFRSWRRREHPRSDLAGHALPHRRRAVDHDGRSGVPAPLDRARAGGGRCHVGRHRHQLRGVPLRLRAHLGRRPRARGRQRAQFERWLAILDAVLDVTRAGATASELTAAAIAVAGGVKPWMPHFYLGHGLGIDSAEMPYVGSDIGEAFDASLVLGRRDGPRHRADRLGGGRRGLPLRRGLADHRGRLGADDRLSYDPF